MLDASIQNPVAAGVWLASGALIAAWYMQRRRADRDLKDQLRGRTDEEAEQQRRRAKARAFFEALTGWIVWLALYDLLGSRF